MNGFFSRHIKNKLNDIVEGDSVWKKLSRLRRMGNAGGVGG